MNHVSAGVLALALAIGGCATQEVQESQQREAPWKKAAVARTRADHQELAAWYARESEAARERAVAHRKMRDGYASSSGIYDVTGFVGHCTSLVSRYEWAAQDSAALAELHRRAAGEAKE